MTGILFAMWKREIMKFFRDRGRIFGALAQPILLWLLLGLGFQSSFQMPDGADSASYLTFLFPGILALLILFTAIFSTISIVEERTSGFLQAALTAPMRRPVLAFGVTLGGATLSLMQVALLLPLSMFTEHQPDAVGLALILGLTILLGIAFTALGVAIAWRVKTTRGFHGIMNVLLMPLWLLSSAFFPYEGASLLMQWIIRLNPVSYAVNGIRIGFEGTGSVVLGDAFTSTAVGSVFAIAMIGLAVTSLRRSPYAKPDLTALSSGSS